jgi:hypothetical protein
MTAQRISRMVAAVVRSFQLPPPVLRAVSVADACGVKALRLRSAGT